MDNTYNLSENTPDPGLWNTKHVSSTGKKWNGVSCSCAVSAETRKIISADEVFSALYGIGRNTLPEISWLFPESDTEKINTALSAVADGHLLSATLKTTINSGDYPGTEILLTISPAPKTNSSNSHLHIQCSPANNEITLGEIRASVHDNYREYFNLSSSATVILINGLITDCNHRACQLFKRKKSELLGKPLGQFAPTDDSDMFVPEVILLSYLTGLQPDAQSFLDWEIARSDETIISTELSAEKIPDPQNESYIITLQDVSEKKMMSEMLHRKNELLQRNHTILYNLARKMEKDLYANLNLITEISTESMNVSSVGIWVFNKNNTSLTSLDFYSAREKAHYSALTATIEDFGDEAERLLTSLLIETSSFGKLREEGSHYLIVPFRVGNQVRGFVHFENQISARQWTPEEKDFALSIADIIALSLENDSYQESQTELKKLGRAIEQSPVSVFITNIRGEFEYVNPAFTNITGYTFEDVLNKTPQIMNSGKMPKSFFKKLWETILQGENFTTEIQNKRKNGELFWESLSVSPIKDDQNKITHFIAVMEDITEKKNLINEITNAKNQAESANRLKSSFLANMSHELRTPMNGIIGYAEVLTQELNENEFRNMAETIFRSGKRLMETLNLILDLSRIEANQMEISYSMVEINSLCEECVILFKESAKKKGLTIYLKDAPFVLSTVTDEKIIRNVLINLVNNAVKYTTEGSVWMEIDLIEEAGGKQAAAIKVCDTGIGIPKRDLDVIFEQFRQVSEGMNRAFEGTGLGLTISKKMIELINGTISVKSELGEGSEFCIEIPMVGGTIVMADNSVRRHTEEDSQNYAPVTGKQGKQLSVLLVENDPINLEVVATYLLNDYQLIIATDAKSAIEKADEANFDAILMDINLGKGMTGLDATKIIRLKEHYAKVPIIAMTAFAMKGDKEEFISAGCSHYLPKPFTKKELFGILNVALSGRET